MIKEEIVINVNTESAQANVKKLDTGIKGVGTTSENVSKGGGGAFNKIGDSVKGIFPALDGAMSGLSGVNKAMLKIVMNPIGLVLIAIVGALTLMYKAFASTNEGADKLEQVMSGLRATVDVVRDRILVAGSAIVKFFSGDFKGAISEGKKAVSGFGEEVGREFRIAANAVKDLQEVEDAMRGLSVSRARLDRDLAKSKELLTDENASYKDKKKALDEIKIAEGNQSRQELANAQKKLNAIVAQNKQSDTSNEDLKKESDARVTLYNLQQKSAEDNRSINKQEKRAHSDEMSRLKEISDARSARAKIEADRQKEIVKAREEHAKAISEFEKNLLKSNQDLNDRTDQEKLDRQKERDILALENLKATEEEKKNSILLINEKYATLQFDLDTKIALDKKTKDEKDAADKKTKDEKEIADAKKLADEKIAIEKQVGDARKSIQDSQINNVSAGINLLAQLAGKNKSIQKAALVAESAIGIAKIIINTKAANAAAKLKYALLPGGIALASAESLANNISAGIGIAGNILATSKGLSALGGGGGSANAGQDGGRDSSPAAPSFNLVQGTGSNQVAQSLNKQQQPIKAFVVSTDVTTNQAYDRNIVNNSKIG